MQQIKMDTLDTGYAGKQSKSGRLKTVSPLPTEVRNLSQVNPADTLAANTDNLAFEKVNRVANRREVYTAVTLIVSAVVIFFTGRALWDERYYTPDEGLGYYLGLVGGVMMLFALSYSLFKYIPKLVLMGGLSRWLKLHVIFGVFGPFLVLLHSTFHLGSLNGSIAFISMALVFFSGIIGRFLYSRIHYGLGGHRAKIGDMKSALSLAGQKIKSQQLDNYTDAVLSRTPNMLTAFADLLIFLIQSMLLYRKIVKRTSKHLRVIARQNHWNKRIVRAKKNHFKIQLKYYFQLLRKTAHLKLYERFFHFWRRAHMPLLYLLVLTGVVHVIAVHMF